MHLSPAVIKGLAEEYGMHPGVTQLRIKMPWNVRPEWYAARVQVNLKATPGPDGTFDADTTKVTIWCASREPADPITLQRSMYENYTDRRVPRPDLPHSLSNLGYWDLLCAYLRYLDTHVNEQ